MELHYTRYVIPCIYVKNKVDVVGSKQKAFVMGSGERYCLLVERSGLPLYYPNLYITTQVRNKSLSFSAMESTLSGISVLNRFF